jgi:hypothetical protein
MACPQCGFDAFLYMVDVKRARAEVEAHWRKKFAEKGVPYPEKPSKPEPDVLPSSGKVIATTDKRPAPTPYLDMKELKLPPRSPDAT